MSSVCRRTVAIPSSFARLCMDRADLLQLVLVSPRLFSHRLIDLHLVSFSFTDTSGKLDQGLGHLAMLAVVKDDRELELKRLRHTLELSLAPAVPVRAMRPAS